MTATAIDTLDELEITDTVFHDLAFTRPLTDRLFNAIQQRPLESRILLVGPNVALAQALVDQGRPVHIWHVPGVALTENLRENVDRVGSLDSLLAPIDVNQQYDVIVLPYVLDSITADPAAALATVRGLAAPNGEILVAVRHAGAIGTRLRAFAGRASTSTNASARHSWSWPTAPPRRVFDIESLQGDARRAGFRVSSTDRVVDSIATTAVDAMSVSRWLRAQLTALTKRAVPALRDTLFATLTPFGGRVTNGYGFESPLVTVVVVGDDADRALRVQGDLAEQTYPRECVEVTFAGRSAAAANEALRDAQGVIVAFTDDWCRPPGGWIESGVRAMGEQTAALAGGILAEQGSAVPFLALPDRRLRIGGNGLYLASNSFYVRDAVLAVGGFDESAAAEWGWDHTAAARLRAAGFPLAEDENAFVFRTYPFPSDRSWIRDEYRRAREIPGAVRRDPNLRRTALHRRYFASDRTWGFDLALIGIGVAVARRQPLYAVGFALPWARTVIEYVDLWPPAEWKTTIRNLRGIGLRNAIWFAGLAAGSVRARRVVL